MKPGRSRGARRAGRGRPGSCALPPSTAGLAFPECTWRVRPRVGVTVVPEGQDICTRCDQRHSGERTAGLRAACGHQTPAALDSGWALSLQEECEELGATRLGGACVRSPPPCCCHGIAQPPGAQPGPRGLHSARCGWGEPGPGAPASAVPSCGRPRLGRRPDLGLKKALLASAMACPVQGTKGSPLKLNLSREASTHPSCRRERAACYCQRPRGTRNHPRARNRFPSALQPGPGPFLGIAGPLWDMQPLENQVFTSHCFISSRVGTLCQPGQIPQEPYFAGTELRNTSSARFFF